jgi:transposase
VEQIHDRVAGLDVHRDSVTVCFRQLGPKGGVVREKDRFATTTIGLKVLAEWLGERQVELVAMEATGVYWKPVYYALEHRFELWLCNARHVKKVPGRKTDLSDAEWLADVAAHGMVRPSFVPPPPIRALRDLTRYRKTQIDARVAEIQRLEKVLQDAGIQAHVGGVEGADPVGPSHDRSPHRRRERWRTPGRAGQGQDAAQDPGAD